MKKTLNEQLSRIKGLMKTINEQEFDDFDTQIQSDELPYQEDINLEDEKEYPLSDLYDLVKKMISKGVDKDTIINIVNFASAPSEPQIGEPSSVESDDYDEKMERNYGVDDRPSDEESMWGPEEDEREDYIDRTNRGED